MTLFVLLGASIFVSFFYAIGKLTLPVFLAALLIGGITGIVIHKLIKVFGEKYQKFTDKETEKKILQSKNKIFKLQEILKIQTVKLDCLKCIVNENWTETRGLQRNLLNNASSSNLPIRIKHNEIKNEIFNKEISIIRHDNILLERIINNSNWQILEYHSDLELAILVGLIISISLYTTRKFAAFLTFITSKEKVKFWLFKQLTSKRNLLQKNKKNNGK